MNSKILVVAWILGVLFTWVLIGAVVGGITSYFGTPEPPDGYFVSALMEPAAILIALGVGSVATPCCYCYIKES